MDFKNSKGPLIRFNESPFINYKFEKFGKQLFK